MGREARVSIILTAKNLANATLGEVRTGVDKIKGAVSSLQGQMAGLGIALSAAGLGKFLVSVNSEYGRLLTQLQTFEGSAAGAQAVFKDLAKFAAVTPFQIDEVVQSYITLRTAGIKPTMESLALFGDQSSAMGRRIQDFAVAIRSATAGEFEPLKSFGVQMHVNGDKAIATFQGVTKVIGRDAQSITNYLEDLSRHHFAGGMERESKTLGGALSNAKDAAESLGRAIGDAGLTNDLVQATQAMTDFLNKGSAVDELAVQYQGFKGVLLTILDVLGLVAHTVAAPIVIVAHLVTGLLHLIAGFVSSTLLPAAAMADAVTGNKFNLSKKLAGFTGGQFKSAGAKGLDAKDTFVSLGEDIGETFANAALRDEALMAAAGRAAAAGDRPAGKGGLKKKGASTAPNTAFNPNAANEAKRAEAERKKRHEEWLSDMTERAALMKELLDLNVDVDATFRDMLQHETRLLNAAARMTDPGDKAKLLRARRDLIDQRHELGFLTGDEQDARVAKLDLQGRLNQDLAQELQKQETANEKFINEAAKRILQDLAPNLVGGTQHEDGTVTGGTFVMPGTNHALASLAHGLKSAIGEGQKLDTLIGNMAAHTFEAFGEAVSNAFAAFVTGSVSAGRAFAGAMLGALGQVAAGFGSFFLGRATAEVAAGIGDLSNPVTAPKAGGHFLSAAKWTGAAFSMFAIAGALSGSASRVTSGGGGRSGAQSSSNSVNKFGDGQGDAVLVVEGGILNMDDPKQADALANALSALSKRRVTIKKRT